MNIFPYMTILMLLIPSLSHGNAGINHAMAAYKEKKYDLAANIILSHQNLNALTIKEKLKASFVFSKNLKFYQEIYEKSKTNKRIYLNTLVNDDNDKKSEYAKFFLAEVLIIDNELKRAKILLQGFKASLTIKSEHQKLADIYLAWIAYLENDKIEYHRAIKTTDRSVPILDMAVQFVEISLTGKIKNPSKKTKSYESLFIKNNKFTSTRFGNYAIQVYLNQNKFDDAINILKRLDLKIPSYTEYIGPIKTLHFYDIKLIDSIAELYYKLTKRLLLAIKEDKKYHDTAIFYLSELDFIRPQANPSRKYLKAVNKLHRLPKNIRDLTGVRSASYQYLLGQRNRAYKTWQDTVNNVKNDPSQSSDVVLMCIYLKANCSKIVKTAQVSAENGQSQRFATLNTNVGRYFLLKHHNAKALRLFENAVERSNTQSIMANDPMLLLNYAEALRLNKEFSKSLQILFSLAENFPIMRQVQNSVQGEYLFRQRSRGYQHVF